MKVEVLLSAMHQNDLSIVDKSKISTDVLIINQCDKEGYEEVKGSKRSIRMYSTMERGLSRSRNMALKNAKGDICILCDDDVVYRDNYEEIVKRAFSQVPAADIIVFNVEQVFKEKERKAEKKFPRISRLPFYKTYGSCHIAFKREAIIKNGITFNTLFGTGSGMYLMAEDSIFCMTAHKARLNCYVYPAVFAKVYYNKSSWFTGYNSHYFFDIGAYLAVAFPKTWNFVKWYYPLKLKERTDLSTKAIIGHINDGVKGYRKGLNFEQYYSQGGNDENIPSR